MSDISTRFTVSVPRHGFSPREVARAGALWRVMQDVAVDAVCDVGWTPTRFRTEGSSFVMRSMTVRHYDEVRFDEELRARTWLRDFRRHTLTSREIRLVGADREIIAATQQWVHVDRNLRPCRAPAELASAFGVLPEGEAVELPDYEARSGRDHGFAVEAWHTWMDPHGHVNHPRYLDLCDESTSRAMAAAGLDPSLLRAVAEKLTFHSGAHAQERIIVESRVVGVTPDGALVTDHELTAGGRVCVKATTLRRAGDGTDALTRALAP